MQVSPMGQSDVVVHRAYDPAAHFALHVAPAPIAAPAPAPPPPSGPAPPAPGKPPAPNEKQHAPPFAQLAGLRQESGVFLHPPMGVHDDAVAPPPAPPAAPPAAPSPPPRFAQQTWVLLSQVPVPHAMLVVLGVPPEDPVPKAPDEEDPVPTAPDEEDSVEPEEDPDGALASSPAWSVAFIPVPIPQPPSGSASSFPPQPNANSAATQRSSFP